MRTFSFFLAISFLLIASAVQPTPTLAPTAAIGDEAQVVALVEDFGQVLQDVSLLAPDAADQIEEKYAEFVSPDLLAAWMAEPTTAPGRLTSSPWPDRIEIENIRAVNEDQYLATGSVIEITSQEQGTDQAAAQYPIQITVALIDGRWMITGWLSGEYQ